MSFNQLLVSQIPKHAIIEHARELLLDHNKYYYQVGELNYIGISVPINIRACSTRRIIYFDIYNSTNRVFISQYSNMHLVNHIKNICNTYADFMNYNYPHMIKYQGTITTTLYNLFEYAIGDQINILTKAHKYISINTCSINELFQLDIQDIYDPNHYIPQEYIKRRIDAMPKPSISKPQVEQNNIEQHAEQPTKQHNIEQQLDDVVYTKKINISESEVKKRNPQRLNAARYIAIRRRRHI